MGSDHLCWRSSNGKPHGENCMLLETHKRVLLAACSVATAAGCNFKALTELGTSWPCTHSLLFWIDRYCMMREMTARILQHLSNCYKRHEWNYFLCHVLKIHRKWLKCIKVNYCIIVFISMYVLKILCYLIIHWCFRCWVFLGCQKITSCGMPKV